MSSERSVEAGGAVDQAVRRPQPSRSPSGERRSRRIVTGRPLAGGAEASVLSKATRTSDSMEPALVWPGRKRRRKRNSMRCGRQAMSASSRESDRVDGAVRRRQSATWVLACDWPGWLAAFRAVPESQTKQIRVAVGLRRAAAGAESVERRSYSFITP